MKLRLTVLPAILILFSLSAPPAIAQANGVEHILINCPQTVTIGAEQGMLPKGWSGYQMTIAKLATSFVGQGGLFCTYTDGGQAMTIVTQPPPGMSCTRNATTLQFVCVKTNPLSLYKAPTKP